MPLSIAPFKIEYDYIKETARMNGYNCEIVDNPRGMSVKESPFSGIEITWIY